MKPKRAAALAAGAALLALAPGPGAAAPPPGDLEMKAAFLTKFPAYVAWPARARPRPGAPFQICIVGADPFGRLLDRAAGSQQVHGHGLQVRRIEGPAQAGGCHVAFIQGGSAAALQALQAPNGKAVLTVTDSAAGPRGMIHFVRHRGRVRFDIDEAQAAASGIGISSRLLGIALTVRQRP